MVNRGGPVWRGRAWRVPAGMRSRRVGTEETGNKLGLAIASIEGADVTRLSGMMDRAWVEMAAVMVEVDTVKVGVSVGYRRAAHVSSLTVMLRFCTGCAMASEYHSCKKKVIDLSS